MKKILSLLTLAAALLISTEIAAQSPPTVQTNVVILNPKTFITWDATTDTNIHGFWAQMEQGTNLWKRYTRTNVVNLIDINPGVTSGDYLFSVTAVNHKGHPGKPTVVSTNLTKLPSVVMRVRIETTIEVN